MSESTIDLGGITCMVTSCITCGIPFTVPLNVYETHKTEGGYHSCPNGHQQGWDKDGSELGRLRLERDRLAQRIAQRDDEIKYERERADREARSASAYKVRVTKLQKRAKAGVCPCCNRTFKQLSAHMQTKHPDFRGEAEDNVVPMRSAR